MMRNTLFFLIGLSLIGLGIYVFITHKDFFIGIICIIGAASAAGKISHSKIETREDTEESDDNDDEQTTNDSCMSYGL